MPTTRQLRDCLAPKPQVTLPNAQRPLSPFCVFSVAGLNTTEHSAALNKIDLIECCGISGLIIHAEPGKRPGIPCIYSIISIGESASGGLGLGGGIYPLGPQLVS